MQIIIGTTVVYMAKRKEDCASSIETLNTADRSLRSPVVYNHVAGNAQSKVRGSFRTLRFSPIENG